MKARFCTRISLGLALSALPFVAGCTQQSRDNSPSLISSAKAETTSATTNSAAPQVADDDPPPALESAAPSALVTGNVSPAQGGAVTAPAPVVEAKLPPNIRPASPLAEIVKLAQAGVDEGVMLSYVTNSTGTFSVGSDEIIYLNDIGVPNQVVTTMIEHDKALKDLWISATQSQTAAATPTAPAPETSDEQTAAAPSYVNPPAAESQPTIVNNNYFYDTLSPYGSWMNVDGYGLCWQPTVVVGNPGWQPYGDRGRWIYTDAGWYWLSDYSWGATTFHYGRWFSHPRYGWCWWPDRVWGPSWVTWRYSGDYCGWAPLPPTACYAPGFGFSYYGASVGFSFGFGLGASCYTWVPTAHFCDSRPWNHRASPHHGARLYENTTPINNFGSGRNNTVINRGIAPEQITSVTRTDVRRANIRDAASPAGKGFRSERLDHDGTLVVHRPRVPEIRHDTRLNAEPGSGKTSALAPAPTTPDARGTASPASPAQGGREEFRPVNRRAAVSAGRSQSQAISPATPAGSTATTPAIVRPSPARPDSQPDQNRGGNDSRRIGNRGSEQRTTTPATTTSGSELATRPSTAASAPTPAAPAAPRENPRPRSIIVIGKRDSTSQQQNYQVYSSPGPQTQPARPTASPERPSPVAAPQSQVTSPALAYNAPSSSLQPALRQEPARTTRTPESPVVVRQSFSAPAAPTRSVSPAAPAPSYSAPASAPSRPAQFSAPSVSAPRPSRTESASPVTIAPRSTPSSSYSPPASAPAQRTPAPSSPSSASRSDSAQGRERR